MLATVKTICPFWETRQSCSSPSSANASLDGVHLVCPCSQITNAMMTMLTRLMQAYLCALAIISIVIMIIQSSSHMRIGGICKLACKCRDKRLTAYISTYLFIYLFDHDHHRRICSYQPTPSELQFPCFDPADSDGSCLACTGSCPQIIV